MKQPKIGDQVLIVPDVHVPNHDRRAWKLLMDVCRSVKFDHVVVLGDFIDNDAVSLHEPHKVRARNLKRELAAGADALNELWAATHQASHTYCEGNHETRLQRYIARKAPELEGLLSVKQSLLGNSNAGAGDLWRWVPYNESVRLGKVNFTHDVGEAGLNAHRGAAKAFMSSAIIGHTHRMSYEVTGRVDGAPVLGAMFGWLGDYRRVDYQHRAKAKQWPLGFGTGVFGHGGVIHVQPVPIINYTCCVYGDLHVG